MPIFELKRGYIPTIIKKDCNQLIGKHISDSFQRLLEIFCIEGPDAIMVVYITQVLADEAAAHYVWFV